MRADEDEPFDSSRADEALVCAAAVAVAASSSSSIGARMNSIKATTSSCTNVCVMDRKPLARTRNPTCR